MKKNYTSIVLAGGLAIIGLLGGCKKAGQGDGPANNLTLETRRPFGSEVITFSPMLKYKDFVGKTNDNGEPLCEADIIRVSYDENIKNPFYFIAKDSDELASTVLSGTETNEKLKKYDEAYFGSHIVVVVALPFRSGSVQIEMNSVRFSGGKVNIGLTSSSGDVVTEDMATFYAVIGLEKATFGEDAAVEVIINSYRIKPRTNDSVEE